MTAIRTKKPVSSPAQFNGRLNTFVVEDQSVHIPDWVKDLKSFRRWIHSDEVPEKGPRICFFNGEVWVDMSKEQAFTHNRVKTEYSTVLDSFTKRNRRGSFFSDGMLLTNLIAGLSCQPDGLFVAEESWDCGKIRLVEGTQEGYVELEGTPDMVLEVVSTSSVKKDLEKLFDLYWKARIPEYWVVDVRKEKLVFDIYRHSPRGYVAVAKKAGWVRSEVLGKSFRLIRQINRHGHPEFNLEMR